MSWLEKLKAGLQKSAQRLNENLGASFRRGTHSLTDVQEEEIFEALVSSDVGSETATFLCQQLKKRKLDTVEEARQSLKKEIMTLLASSVQPFSFSPTGGPQVIVMIGVNGSGKTTSIAKLTRLYQKEGCRVMWAACDTFRAAAVDQLTVWAERLHVPTVTEYPGHGSKIDPASLAYHAFQRATEEAADILFVDTAGRLHNNEALMKELARITKSLGKINSAAPQQTLLVLDATTGQALIPQVQVFRKAVPVTGLVITKLDGSSKAGSLIPITLKTQLPIVAVGVGEGLDDMNVWDPEAWTEALLDIKISDTEG